jgi:hypothetical protein
MPAKPQQMSDSQEKSDDLIAELAKLMASNAQGAEGAPKPTVIKLPPLNEATVKTASVRIPGMDSTPSVQPEAAKPAATASPAPASAPVVRIPGLEKPSGAEEAPKPATAEPKPAPRFDFGKPPTAPAIATEPLANWQAHTPPRMPGATQGQPTAGAENRPQTAAPVAEAKPAATSPQSSVAASPAASPPPRQPEASSAAADGISFDFGFGGSKAGAQDAETKPSNDPIADLIAAELDAVEAAPARPAEPAPVVHPTPAPASASAPSALAAPANEKPAPANAAVAAPLKPVSVAPRPADGDRFTVAPVFGLGSKPAPAAEPAPAPAPTPMAPPRPAARAADADPMDEIESLIGEAVRVEWGGQDAKPATPPHEPAPVVPPLGTSFAPRRAGIKADNVDSAEAAILAAAAASGAEIGHVDAPAQEERPYKRMKVKPPRTSMISSGARQYVGIAVAGTLLLAAGFALYWVLGMSRDDPATAPVLTADIAPAKVEPVATVETTEPSGSVVFNEINGQSPSGQSETLVSRDQTAGATPTEVARTVTPSIEVSETGLANRKVRTVTVRPDGTIVSGDEAVAGNEALPVERPNVPEIAGSEIAPSDLLTAAVAETEAVASVSATAPAAAGADPIAALVADTSAADTEPLELAAVEPTGTVAPVFDGSLVAPLPMPRPTSRTGLGGGTSVVGGTNVTTANAPASTPLVAVAQQPAATTQVSSGGGAYVQLSSQRSEGEAAQSLATTQRRMSGMLNGASLEIRRVDLGAKGVWYRVVLPVNSFQDATQTCAAIKSNGGDCVAING